MYYGIHHEAREFLTRRIGVTNFVGGWDPVRQRQVGSHECVIALVASIDPDVADRMRNLRAIRVHADDELAEPWSLNSRDEVRSSVRAIRQFLGTA
jgi:hypothetical protein